MALVRLDQCHIYALQNMFCLPVPCSIYEGLCLCASASVQSVPVVRSSSST